MLTQLHGAGAAILAFFQVVLIDVSLAGDNAIAVGLAASGLPQHQRRRAIVVGLAGAVVVARPGDDRRVAYWQAQLTAFGAVPVASPHDGYAVYHFGAKPQSP